MKQIPLLNSKKKAKVDDEDYEKLSVYDWYLSPDGYAVRPMLTPGDKTGDQTGWVFMHDEVLFLAGEMDVIYVHKRPIHE